ncbi:MAG: DegT/DnrJ/EryC1/StrS family aminotransferase [Chitinophagaceae bacterium]|nr:DegT/DnrJ/EryC1/StrS family aminotransferase [Chitinophagaceae bacterium]
MSDFDTVRIFEKRIAEFFGAPYAVATDSCTHAVEMCLRLVKADHVSCPTHTYLSIPMLASKLGIGLQWRSETWLEQYDLCYNIIDAATMFRKGSYVEGSLTCLSFQHQKHLSLGRGGMVLLYDRSHWFKVKLMSYDGRLPYTPWRKQDIDTIGYHYYMTPETAADGIRKLPEAIATPPRIWSSDDYPDLTKMKVFK